KDTGGVHYHGYFDGHILIEGNSFIENRSGVGSGGAIYIQYGYATIRDNYISGNLAEDDGGGIYGGAVIENNVFVNNRTNSYGGGIYKGGIVHGNLFMNNVASFTGGGMYAWGDSFTGNTFIRNESQYSSGGGAYIRTFNNDFHIENNVFRENRADDAGGGLLVSSNGMRRIFIRNNIMTDNTCGTAGGGLYLNDSGGYHDVVFTNNTVCNNSAVNSGGGVYLSSANTVDVRNSIFWNNSAPENKEIYDYAETMVFRYCDVDDELLAVEPGCFRMDPLFVSPSEGDYHIKYGSPCMEAGDPLTLLLEDFEGDPRDAGNEITDIGADEFYTHLYCTGDFTPGGNIDGKFIGLPGTTPVGLFLGSGELDPPLKTMWGNFYLEAPWFLIPLGLPIPSDGILKIPATIPALPVGPYDVYMQALIGLAPDSLSNLFTLEIR
ncbi:MAG: right-handed parallel beta-helix repeat-containing protein, partial [Planctomycetota bacterium]